MDLEANAGGGHALGLEAELTPIWDRSGDLRTFATYLVPSQARKTAGKRDSSRTDSKKLIPDSRAPDA